MNTSPPRTESAAPVMYLDFDGVFNFFGSRTAFPKKTSWGYLRRDSARGYSLNFSLELARKWGALPADWLWLTTWKKSTSDLNPLLELPDSTPWLDWEEKGDFYNLGKYEALVTDQRTNPRPFIWADDVATVAYNKNDFNVPHLVLTPSGSWGLTREDYTTAANFLNNLNK